MIEIACFSSIPTVPLLVTLPLIFSCEYGCSEYREHTFQPSLHFCLRGSSGQWDERVDSMCNFLEVSLERRVYVSLSCPSFLLVVFLCLWWLKLEQPSQTLIWKPHAAQSGTAWQKETGSLTLPEAMPTPDYLDFFCVEEKKSLLLRIFC